MDGVALYDYLVGVDSKYLVCRDVLPGNSFATTEDIHGVSKHIPVEFAGALAALLFYVSLYTSLYTC